MNHSRIPVVCSIGSIDPLGASGLTMDLRVYAHLGAAGLAVVAAVTAQNSRRVTAVGPLSPTLIAKQLQSIWEQVKPDAVCIGLLPGVPTIKAVSAFLRRLSARPPIVLDPVMAASSGSRFLALREIRQLKTLLPLATVVTPNVFEAAAFTGSRVTTLLQAQAAARELNRYGCAALVTGGHLPGTACVDVLAVRGRARRFVSSRLHGEMRGAGGILSAALAVNLARGMKLERAIGQARQFVRRAHRNTQRLGSGTPQFIAR
ncbi:MAG: hydroxymethylpyrimidine/phosphomethylpyrimidine kinase [Candidatus Eremiobacteraeota bacterium]|nr:hydroxymethylpyrimidine/phosphomethylpyrimidine kinase [Candidatus Eremiobacteraeota bacterium]